MLAALRPRILLALLALPALARAQTSLPDTTAREGHGGVQGGEATDEMTPARRAEIMADLEANVARLRAEGVTLPAAMPAGSYGWPLRSTAPSGDAGFYGISNFLDRDPSTGVSDWNCGARAYDGHRGLDVFPWPFPWTQMDNGTVEVVAAAPGVIIGKEDGRPDRSCAFSQLPWNAVYVRHDDGSTAWYGHLRTGSVTATPVGGAVAAGERLGLIGSSGNSTGPHLHLEVYDAQNVLVDPYAGACHSGPSTWSAQEPYYVSTLSAVRTHSAPPVIAECPSTADTPHEADRFAPGSTLYVGAYYRDQRFGQPSQFVVRRPDGSAAFTWSSSLNVDHYAASWWWWSRWLPTDAPLGTWTLEAAYQGQAVTRTFTVGTGVATATQAAGGLTIAWPHPNPVAARTALALEAAQPVVLQVTVVDAMGRAVAVLHDGPLAAGPHALSLETSGLAAGVYVVRVEGAGLRLARPFTVAR